MGKKMRAEPTWNEGGCSHKMLLLGRLIENPGILVERLIGNQCDSLKYFQEADTSYKQIECCNGKNHDFVQNVTFFRGGIFV
jgi:hypothetical protein